MALAFEPLAVADLDAHLGVERKTPSVLPLTHRDDGLMFYKWMLAWFNAPTPGEGDRYSLNNPRKRE